jgi:hypothetical protein
MMMALAELTRSKTASRRRHRRHDAVRALRWKRQPCLDHKGAGATADKAHGIADGRIGMIGDQHLVTGLEGERAQHRIDAGCGVVDEHQILGRHA